MPRRVVVIASAGYPGSYESGKVIDGLEAAAQLEGVVVFHAGTKRGAGGQIETAGGRVLGVTARAATLDEATAIAYQAVERIYFEGPTLPTRHRQTHKAVNFRLSCKLSCRFS